MAFQITLSAAVGLSVFEGRFANAPCALALLVANYENRRNPELMELRGSILGM